MSAVVMQVGDRVGTRKQGGNGCVITRNEGLREGEVDSSDEIRMRVADTGVEDEDPYIGRSEVSTRPRLMRLYGAQMPLPRKAGR